MRPYLVAVVRSLSEIQPRELGCVLFESPHTPLGELPPSPSIRRITCKGVPSSRLARVVYQNSVYPRILRRRRLDAYLGTCNVVPLGSPKPFAVVVQSTQFFAYPRVFGLARAAYLRLALRFSVRQADAVIAISAFEKQELMRFTGIHTDCVHVVHHGIFADIEKWRDTTTPGAAPESPYILFVSTLYRYKNIERLLQAYASVRHRAGVPHRLRVIGGEGDLRISDLRRQALRLGVADMVDFAGSVPHADIPRHYAGADLFIYPSLYETFGHPPLEAMVIGCPVAAARAGSIPEIVGDAAELFDPLSCDDMARSMELVLTNPGRRQKLIAKGRVRRSEFTWQKAAGQLLHVLERAKCRQH